MNHMKKFGASGLPMPREIAKEVRAAMKAKEWDLFTLGNACGCAEEFLLEVIKGSTPISRHLVASLEFALGAPRGRWQLEVGYLPTSVSLLGKTNPQITELFHRLTQMEPDDLSRFADSHADLLQAMELVDTMRQHKLTPGSRAWLMANSLMGRDGNAVPPQLIDNDRHKGSDPC